jgi:glycosyltransferase involved in cell wall biosynthesis
MKRPLRVVQVNSMFSGGGVDRQTLELSAGLRDAGVEVTLAIAGGSRWEPLARNLGVRVVSFPARSPLRSKMIAAVRRTIVEADAEVVHLHQGRDYWPGIIAARLAGRGTRVVITRHLMTRPRGFSRRSLLQVARIIAVSRAVEGVLRAELLGNPKHIFQAYCGIDAVQFPPVRSPAAEACRLAQGWLPQHTVFGVVGMYPLPRGKGQLEFLEAASRIHRDNPDARFALIGQGTLRPQIEEAIGRLGLGALVQLIPFSDDIVPWMGALDILVHPAVGTDAFPLVVLEGMASGKPIIASAIDGIPEEFSDGIEGFLVPRADVGALSGAMGRLAQDPLLRRQMGEAGRLRVMTHFTRSHLARNTLAIYQSILGNGRAG